MGETAKGERSSSRAGSTQVHQGKQQNEPGLDRVIQAQIGDKLRAMYGELVEQPVPDRLASILQQLSQGKTDKGAS